MTGEARIDRPSPEPGPDRGEPPPAPFVRKVIEVPAHAPVPKRRSLHGVLVSRSLPKGFLVLGADPVTFGRANDAQVPLLVDGVSRHHGRIHWERGGHWLTDLASTNGTLVNELPIAPGTPRRLVTGDAIAFGPVRLRFEVTSASREELEVAYNPGTPDTTAFSVQPQTRGGQLGGTIAGSMLIEACHLIELNNHTGEVRVAEGGPAGATGWLRFRQGLIVDARLGPLGGEEAVRACLSLTRGDYVFVKADGPPPEGRLRVKVSAIAIDVLRTLDERASVPPPPQTAVRTAFTAVDGDDDAGEKTRQVPRPPAL